jgi:hypothetical protein
VCYFLPWNCLTFCHANQSRGDVDCLPVHITQSSRVTSPKISPHVYQMINIMVHFIVSISYPKPDLTGEGKETVSETRVKMINI